MILKVQYWLSQLWEVNPLSSLLTLGYIEFLYLLLDKFLLVMNLPIPLRDISVKNLQSRDNDVIIEDSLQFSVYGSVVPAVQVPSEDLY